MQLKNVRGTHDLFFSEVEKFQIVENAVDKIASLYLASEIRTPIFEFKGVFEKNIGENTDIVNKEMYVLQDRNGEDLVLRPEGTAPVVRAVLSNKLTHELPLKFFYKGPMFRYERPQKGRQRQFNQLGFEYLGCASFVADAEMILCAVDILKELNISNYKVLINSLGSIETLNSYKEALKLYLKNNYENLSEYSKVRYENNPLRFLDSKEEQDKNLMDKAPILSNFLSEEDKNHFNNVLKILEKNNIDYEISDNLVRGLDYYNHTVFEIVTEALGSQGTLLAGGRYNGLFKAMGHKEDVACFGFAGGIERLVLMLNTKESKPYKIAVISQHNDYDIQCVITCNELRKNLFACDVIIAKDMGAKLKKASQKGYLLALIIGEEEIKNSTITIKNLAEFSQENIDISNVIKYLNDNYQNIKQK